MFTVTLGCALPPELGPAGCGVLQAWGLEEAFACPKEQRMLEPSRGTIPRAMWEADGQDPKGCLEGPRTLQARNSS